MREILFRGKAITSKKWIYGDLLQYADVAQIWEDTEQGKFNVLVIAETVGQYTGLTDKNGKKIFEGDIIKYSHRGINEKAIIKYGAPKERYTMYGWYLDDNHGNTAFLLSEYFIEFYDCVIIGNIYDNPELMGGEANG